MPPDDWWPVARGRRVNLLRHAVDGMDAERPRVRVENVLGTLEEPDHDDGKTARKRIGPRTIIVRYTEHEVEIRVRSVSATRRRLPP